MTKLETFVVIILVIIFIFSGIGLLRKETIPIINVNHTTCNLDGVTKAINDRGIITNTAIRDKECSLEFVKPYIQFYPRKERKCKRPIQWEIYGSSMQPFLYAGDSFFVEKVKFKDVELGDVIIYQSHDESSVIHAVVAIYPDGVITAGYSLWYEDNFVEADKVLYRYCKKQVS